MVEVVVLSFFVGGLGLQTAMLGGWHLKQLKKLATEQAEEEETLTRYESQEYMVASEVPIGAPGGTPHQPDTATHSIPASLKQNGVLPHAPQEESIQDPRLTGWEFKIVRSNRDLFRNPAAFQRLCKEEAESGWLLLEKLDDRRVRFRRPMALREIIKPEFLNHDPYRTQYGHSTHLGTWLFGLAFLVTATTSAYLGYALVKVTLNKMDVAPSPLPAQSFPTLPGTLPSPTSAPGP